MRVQAAALAAAAARRSTPALAPALRRAHTEAAESTQAAAAAAAASSSSSSATAAASSADSLISCVQCGAPGPLEYEPSMGAHICLTCGHAETRAATTMLAAALHRARSTPAFFAPAAASSASSSSVASAHHPSLLTRLSESMSSAAGGSAGFESMHDAWGGSDSFNRSGHGSSGARSSVAPGFGSSFVSKESTRTALSKSASSAGFALAASGMIADAAVTDSALKEREGRRRQARRAREIMDKLRMPPRWASQLFAMLEQAARGVQQMQQAEIEETTQQEEAAPISGPEEHAAKRARTAAVLGTVSPSAAAAPPPPPSVPLRFSHGHLGDLVIGSCCLQLCRTHGRACSMLDVSDALGLNVFRFGAAFAKVCGALGWNSPRLDAAVFVERVIASVAEAQNQAEATQAREQQPAASAGKRKRIAAASSSDPPQILDASPLSAVRLAVRQDAHALLRLASRSSLDCGRHPLSLAGGAVHLALQCHSVASSLDALGAACKIGPRTIQSRAKEIQEVVTALGAEHMPALQFEAPAAAAGKTKRSKALQPNFAFVVEHIDTILRIIEATENAQAEAAAATSDATIAAEEKQQDSELANPTEVSRPSSPQPTHTPPSSLPTPPASVLLARPPVASDPPAFHRAHAQRIDRFQRLQRAAQRLQISTSVAAASSSFGSSDSLDDEDRLLERLLSRGVPLVRLLDDSLERLREAEIENAAPAAATSPAPLDRALGEADLSEAELAFHLRSPAELAQWQRLDAEATAAQQQLEGL